MTKSELIEKLAQAEGLTAKAAELAVDTVIESLEDCLAAGDRVEIRGFGALKVKNYDGYQGRNPKTGKPIRIDPKKLPVFKMGKELKDRVDGKMPVRLASIEPRREMDEEEEMEERTASASTR